MLLITRKSFRVFLLIILFTPFVAFAHSEGASWEKTVGNYKIDIGYDPDKFVVGKSARLDFNVIEAKTGQTADFGDVWVRIEKDRQTVFASGIHKPDLGKTGMTFVFPNAGEYTLHVRFEKGDKSLAEASFPVSVLAEEGQSQVLNQEAKQQAGQELAGKNSKTTVVGAVGIVLGMGLGWFLKRTRKQNG